MDKKINLLIFDLDGTILNTLDDLADSTNFALEKNGYKKRTIDEIKSFVGNGIGKLIERAVPEGVDDRQIEKVLCDFKEHYGLHCADKTCPYKGIKELIVTLKEQGYMTAVVSNKADFAVQALCEDYFPGLFDYVVGEKEDVRRKPYPDSVNKVLEVLGIERENAVYIGDSDVDIKTAENADMMCISVTWGFRDKAFLVENGGKIFVDSPHMILNLLR